MNRTSLPHRSLVVVAVASCAAAGVLLAQPDRTMHRASPPGHVMVAPDDLEWKPGPASLPSRAEMAVLEGDPTQPGPFTFRLKVPAGYEIPAHHHPQIEHVTVISGSFSMGEGDKLDREKAKRLPVGGFAVMPIGMRHFAFTDEESIVQIHGVGPWGITYVDPATDPRNRPQR